MSETHAPGPMVPVDDTPPSADAFTVIEETKRTPSRSKLPLLAIPAVALLVLIFLADADVAKPIFVGVILVVLAKIVITKRFSDKSASPKVKPTDIDEALPRSANPRLGWFTRRQVAVDEAYADRGSYLKATRTHTTIIPEHRLTRTIFQIVRRLTIFVSWFGVNPPTRPFYPRPVMAVRREEARVRIARPIFNRAKVVSFFMIKGGVGKTTLAKIFGLLVKKWRPDLSVLIQDCDNGTLIARGERTNKLSMIDVIANLDDIKTPTALARYCTVTPEGASILAYKRPDAIKYVKSITRKEMRELIERECQLVDIVVNDLAPNEDQRNRGALDRTDSVVIVITPAKDVIAKGIDTFGFLLSHGYAGLARSATILVNRRMPWTSLDKIRQEFVDAYPDDMSEVKITGFNHSVQFQMGLNVVLHRLSRRNMTTELELVASTLEGLADASTDDESSQKTHAELRREQIVNRGQATSPQIGGNPPPAPRLLRASGEE